MLQEKKLKGRSADVLYRVDPQKLSIKICYTSSSSDQTVDYTTTFESFAYERIETHPDVPKQVRQLPAYVDGQLFFGSEEEAQEYVRRQIGM